MRRSLCFLVLALACSRPMHDPGKTRSQVDAGNQEATMELVVVFQKDVTDEAATAVLEQLGRPYREGSDSSRGKGYFYAHGPHFIVTLPVADRAAFEEAAKTKKEIFETYEPDWDIQKD